MWTISSATDIPLLRGGGGQPFTGFVDTLLQTQCFVYGVPQAAIATTLRVNVRDGGVDTRVDQRAAGDQTGYLGEPSAWQFKAEPVGRVTDGSITKEIHKHYATELVRKGYAYRVCVCDEITAKKKEHLNSALNVAAQAIKPGAAQCHVLSASDLARWANRLPGVVGTVFGRPTNMARHWRAWDAAERAITPNYVLPDGWAPIIQAIQQHLQFSFTPFDPVLQVQGLAGVGKTRLVHEAIRRMPGAPELVVVTSDGRRAQETALWLVNAGQHTAILVADECPLQARYELNGLLRGHESRIRAIAIDNTGEPPPRGAPGIWIEKISIPTAEQILQQNFSVVPPERRRAYADRSGGYIRLAADLCRHDGEMHSAGSLQPAIPTLQDYYRSRLSPDDQKVVEAISLVQRIGHSDDVAVQLDLLTELTGVRSELVRETVARLKDAPGFIVVTPRYYYVTPQIIAEIAFRRAWERLASQNPAAFLDRIPELLRGPFELRIRGLSIGQEVRSIVGAHFQKRVADFTPADLADSGKIKQLVGLLETDPAAYLPQLTRLVRDASNAELLATGGSDVSGRGTRREMVWAAERLAIFPEYFEAAELVLRRLAVNETEHGIGNNATGIWRQLFRVYLSGTAVPFRDRFNIFRRVVFSENIGERKLALGGLDHLIDRDVTRMGTPSVVGGKIPPPDWHPRTQSEFEDCFAHVIGLTEELLARSEPFAAAGWNYLRGHLRLFLAWGKLDRLEEVVQHHGLPPDLLGPWLEQVDDFLQYERGVAPDVSEDHVEYCNRVRAWQESLIPLDYSGRLRGIVGKDIWHHSMREDVHKEQSEIIPLVEEAFADPRLLHANLPFLASPEARSASTFGVLLGRKDTSGDFLEPILSVARKTRFSALLRGYVGGLLQTSPGERDRISGILDALERDDPEMVAEIIVADVDQTDAVTRLTRLVGDGRLSPRYMQVLHIGGVVQGASSPEFAELLKVLTREECPPESLKIAVELAGDRIRGVELANEAPEAVTAIKRVLARSAVTEDRADYWWRDAMEHLASIDTRWTAEVASAAFSGNDFSKRDDASSILSKIASNNPDAVMAVVGEALLDSKGSWRWQIGSNRDVFSSLPVQVVMDWLAKTGLEGARRIARHLSSPTVAENGTLVVPELTEQVLVAYGDDEEVFREFAVGRHDLEASWGPISSHHEAHARIARAFLNHPLPVIRRWAEHELAAAEHFAGIWRRQEEDEGWSS
ncbi:MAG TPA: hypothetical protein VKX49_01325 [Bryobacteraceae bacterium]|nr:hypothetical protein [Bryobacteraceae bacterium]